jgi:hypothetical protein
MMRYYFSTHEDFVFSISLIIPLLSGLFFIDLAFFIIDLRLLLPCRQTASAQRRTRRAS